MVDVRVREQHEGHFARRESEAAVAGIGVTAALEHAAVDQEAHAARVDFEARAGDFAGCAMEGEFQSLQRYAKGELTREQFERMKSDLAQDAGR